MAVQYQFIDRWYVPAPRATLDWRPAVEKPLVKHLTPVLRPLFRANHLWAIRRGQEGILEYMRRRGERR